MDLICNRVYMQELLEAQKRKTDEYKQKIHDLYLKKEKKKKRQQQDIKYRQTDTYKKYQSEWRKKDRINNGHTAQMERIRGKRFYENHKEKIKNERKHKYMNDPIYREMIKARNREIYRKKQLNKIPLNLENNKN